MSKGLIYAGIVILLLVAGCLYYYNTLIAKDEFAATAWNNMRVQYQHKADLVSQAVDRMRTYVTSDTAYVGVVDANAKARQLTNSTRTLTPEGGSALLEAQGALSAKLETWLMQYKGDSLTRMAEDITEIQARMAGIERRIDSGRQAYNQAVEDYNLIVDSFPSNIVAKIFGFKARAPFLP